MRDHCHYNGEFRRATNSICNLRYRTPKEIPVVFHNGSTYDYHFIIKQLPKKFDGWFECLEENTERYITFSPPIENELYNGKTITYKLKFIASFRFMSTSLSKLGDNLSEIYSKECKRCKSVCDFIRIKNDKFYCKCNECKIRQLKPINGLIEKFPNIYQFCNGDINKFVLLLKKGVHPYEYMSNWKRFAEKSLPYRKAFYSKLYLEDITDEDYTYAQKVFKFKLKNLGDYQPRFVCLN